MIERRKTAAYQVIPDAGGNRYKFYCDVSGAHACTTAPYKADTPEDELILAWENEGKKHFSLCHKCGKWVISAVYNPEVFECTDCAPFEHATRFCKFCGSKVSGQPRICPVCNKKLHYEGGHLP